MKRTGLLLAVLMLAPAFASAASREMIELQRDVAQLQDQVRTLQRAFDERFAALQVLVQQSLDASNKTNGTLQNADRNTERIVAPIAGLNSKVDQMGGDVSGLRESVNDLTVRMNKIQQQLIDLGNVIKALQVPAAPPPAAPGTEAAPGTTGAAGTSPATAAPAGPPVKATTLYENALADMQGGKSDLALGEFQDYIRFYNSTDLAPNAQYYIGYIHYSQAQFDLAIMDFDKVLEAYPDNPKTPDAHYMKGKTLFQLGQRTAAAKEFKAIVSDFPNSSVAPNARAQLKALGVNVGAAPARKRK